MNREHRNLLLGGQLLLISPYDPSAGFNVGYAMQRNKLIYALADASLVVSSDLNKGGTWAGAKEQLDKLKLVPVYIRSTGESSAGLDALRKKGAIPWPNPKDADDFEHLFDRGLPTTNDPQQSDLALSSRDEPADVTSPPLAVQEVTAQFVARNQSMQTPVSAKIEGSVAVGPGHSALIVCEHEALPEAANSIAETESNPADILFAAVQDAIQRLLKVPMKDAEIATALDVSGAQAKAWLQRLVEEGLIEKQKKPAGYVIKQPDLFKSSMASELE